MTHLFKTRFIITYFARIKLIIPCNYFLMVDNKGTSIKSWRNLHQFILNCDDKLTKKIHIYSHTNKKLEIQSQKTEKAY